jgi:hypothetical protein
MVGGGGRGSEREGGGGWQKRGEGPAVFDRHTGEIGAGLFGLCRRDRIFCAKAPLVGRPYGTVWVGFGFSQDFVLGYFRISLRENEAVARVDSRPRSVVKPRIGESVRIAQDEFGSPVTIPEACRGAGR